MEYVDAHHRGRIQAQGGDLEESEAWAQKKPLNVDDALQLVKNLQDKIPVKELILRQKEFNKAIRFIKEASENGGVNAISKSFRVKGTINSRVDIEVIKGLAFVKTIISSRKELTSL